MSPDPRLFAGGYNGEISLSRFKKDGDAARLNEVLHRGFPDLIKTNQQTTGSKDPQVRVEINIG